MAAAGGLRGLSAGASGGDAAERRAAPRSTLVCKALVYPPSGPPVRVLVSNISLTGVGLRSVTPLEPGSGYRVTLEAGPLSLRSGVEVVRCTPRSDRSYDIGARLDATDLAAQRRQQAGVRCAPAKVAHAVPRNPSMTTRYAARGGAGMRAA
ncbi:MAG: PilZ domain-containing protein [Tepidisphaerales bacterium]